MRDIRMMAIAAMALTVAVSAWAADGIWYVDKDNQSGVEDGITWQTAFATIQPALDAAVGEAGGEVWVAEGLYDEYRVYIAVDQGTEANVGAVYIPDGVALYGGFSGSETSVSQRDVVQHVTTIDASRARDGLPAYFAVFAGDDTILDGFVITGAVANEGELTPFRSGGGWRSVRTESSASIANCIFKSNISFAGGSGLAFGQGLLEVINCTFEGGTGTACSLALATAVFRCCTFSDNVAPVAAGVSATGGSLRIDRCKFDNNTVPLSSRTVRASAIYAVGDASITNSVFYQNTSGFEKGETLLFVGPNDPEAFLYPTVNVTNCTFYGNNDSAQDAAIRYEGSVEWTLRNCIIVENTGSAIDGGGAGSQLLYSDIRGGLPWPTSGPDQPRWLTVEGLINADPLFNDPDNGDLRLRSGSPCIDAGTSEDAPSSDIRGVPRPIGAGFDIGAYEHLEPDADGDGVTNAVDVQLVINAALGVAPPGTDADVSGDGKVNAVDVQIVINAALGLYG
jgi:hypothetical protein